VGSSVDIGTDLLSESSDWMNVLDVLASGMIGCREPVSHLTTLLVTVISTLDISPDGDDTMRS
jgi:hypothetical protein